MKVDGVIDFGQYGTPYKTTIVSSPTPVGYWVLYPQATPHTAFAMYHKPTDEQIKNTEQLLGWGWRDKL
jgi:hypothetical protein